MSAPTTVDTVAASSEGEGREWPVAFSHSRRCTCKRLNPSSPKPSPTLSASVAARWREEQAGFSTVTSVDGGQQDPTVGRLPSETVVTVPEPPSTPASAPIPDPTPVSDGSPGVVPDAGPSSVFDELFSAIDETQTASQAPAEAPTSVEPAVPTCEAL